MDTHVVSLTTLTCKYKVNLVPNATEECHWVHRCSMRSFALLRETFSTYRNRDVHDPQGYVASALPKSPSHRQASCRSTENLFRERETLIKTGKILCLVNDRYPLAGYIQIRDPSSPSPLNPSSIWSNHWCHQRWCGDQGSDETWMGKGGCRKHGSRAK